MAKNFRDLEREALADPKRRLNVARERARLIEAVRLLNTGLAGRNERSV
jgi:hypothetical protein